MSWRLACRYIFHVYIKFVLERERNRPVAFSTGLTGDQTPNLGVCPDGESSPKPFWCTGQRSNQWGHLTRAPTCIKQQQLSDSDHPVAR